MTPLRRHEYAKVKLSDIPKEVINEYNLREKAGRISRPRLARRTIEQGRVLPEPKRTKVLEAQNKTNTICTGSR
jgi:hypothetical protein